MRKLSPARTRQRLTSFRAVLEKLGAVAVVGLVVLYFVHWAYYKFKPAVAAARPNQPLLVDTSSIAKAAAERELQGIHEIARDGIDDTVTAVVECSTTAGNLTIDVRSAWSPLGSAQYLKIVEKNLFEEMAFTRVCPRYITQYGRKYREPHTPDPLGLPPDPLGVIKDDPSMWGKRDMDFGYVFFAGSGTDSRFDEMVIALCDMKGCRTTGLGKAEWETPVGTIRKEGFAALRKIEDSGRPYPRLEMKGQHPKAGGPNIARLSLEKNYLTDNYPYLHYWKGCRVVSKDSHISRPLTVDHPESEQVHDDSLKQQKQQKKLRGADGTLKEQPPFNVLFKIATPTGEGTVVFEIKPDWAPLGAQRLKELVAARFFDEARFFRVIPRFMAQWGIGATPTKHREWSRKAIKDDAVKMSNSRGTITFATSGKDSRTTQLFVNFVDNKFLDKEGFAPVGRVIKGLDVIDSLYAGYGEGGKGDGLDGKGPSQGRIVSEGNDYLDSVFPKLSYIISTTFV